MEEQRYCLQNSTHNMDWDVLHSLLSYDAYLLPLKKETIKQSLSKFFQSNLNTS